MSGVNFRLFPEGHCLCARAISAPRDRAYGHLDSGHEQSPLLHRRARCCIRSLAWGGSGALATTLAVGPGDPLPDPRLALDAGTDDLDYTLAGSFVTFLLTRHGPENFISFSQRIRNGDKLASIQSSFQAVYGLDFDTEVDLFRFGTPCADNSFSVRVYDCAAPEVTWEDDMWSFTAGMNCADEGGGRRARNGSGDAEHPLRNLQRTCNGSIYPQCRGQRRGCRTNRALLRMPLDPG
jgi:hypothetical protein